jgi:hypothetical protein
MNTPKQKMVATTFQLTESLHEQLKMMCLLTKKKMGEFIRLSIIDKMNQIKVGENPSEKK